jgi:hypothetical protein
MMPSKDELSGSSQGYNLELQSGIGNKNFVISALRGDSKASPSFNYKLPLPRPHELHVFPINPTISSIYTSMPTELSLSPTA